MLPRIKGLLIDLDGVMYRGNTVLPGATEVIPALKRQGVRHAFVTNNATLAANDFADKLSAMGIPTQPEEIVTSSQATAAYLRARGAQEPTGRAPSAFVIGEVGLRSALAAAGIELSSEHPDYVVVGLDRQITYQRLAEACVAIQRGAQLVASNADRALPMEHGELWPGAGALLAAIVACTQAEPVLIGKPRPAILQLAMQRLDLQPSECAMLGDQVAVDICAGKAAGTATILLEGDLAQKVDGVEPDMVIRNLDQLIRWIDTF